jgi:antitoxin component of MazEF toxin-antitoxin module
VKLQKQLSRHFGGREYPKWVVVLPPKLVRELGWREGQELRAEKQGRGLRLRLAAKDRKSDAE